MRILSVAAGDVRRTMRDRSSIFWIFLAPILWVYFFGFISRGGDPGSVKVSLTVYQQDPSAMAERLITHLRAQSFDLRVVPPGQTPRGREPARSITIPAGFGDAIGRREKVTLELRERANADPEQTLAAQVFLHKAVIRLLAAEALGGLDPAEDPVTLASAWAGLPRRPTGYYQTIPGNLVMFVLLSATTYGSALLSVERRDGTLRRLAVSPLTRGGILSGKLAGRVAVAAMQVMVFVVIGLTLFRIDWGSSPLGLAALLVCFIFCAASIGLLGGTLFRSPEASSGVGVTLTLLMSAFGGCWWPQEIMPGWLRTAAYALPTAWAINGLHEMISWGGRFTDVMPHCGVLALMGITAAALAARRLRLQD